MSKPEFQDEAALFEDLKQTATGAIKADIGAVESCRVFVPFHQITNSVAQSARIRIMASSTRPLCGLIYACRRAGA
jgi:hypothetical protein